MSLTPPPSSMKSGFNMFRNDENNSNIHQIDDKIAAVLNSQMDAAALVSFAVRKLLFNLSHRGTEQYIKEHKADIIRDARDLLKEEFRIRERKLDKQEDIEEDYLWRRFCESLKQQESNPSFVMEDGKEKSELSNISDKVMNGITSDLITAIITDAKPAPSLTTEPAVVKPSKKLGT